ncbi:Wzz/FepE/Etk N-terminal domain-containing protein [Dysgonomonas sp. 25]|uniref:Wzz/FepE/Etk N-terminal domain-containing protein n=1 Tax=Dysgonomonas sp. 25 TaxID=2302933 RepID=UPI0013D79132|nr:Wzz/FepE/Etk N-terminal domain-containing protein [Dysgonomonas sp. 25]NDV69011.1 chain-length determining protein [Dysgonomonas sp. 25]
MSNNSEKTKGEIEIDLLALGNKVWSKKKFIFKVVGVGIILGLIIAFSIPKEYTTTVILTPESQASGVSGSMSSLASLAGINLNAAGGQDALASPDLYPDVIRSTPFLRGLFDVEVTDSEQGIDMTLYDYLTEHQKAPWWSYILKAPGLLLKVFSSSDEDSAMAVRPNGRILTQKEMMAIGILAERIFIASDKKTNVTTVEVTMQSPEISAYLADTITSYLQDYIISYRTQKARKDLEYAENLFEESKKDYYQAQKNLASFIDANMNVVSAKYQTRQEQLQNEANLAYSVYNQTAQQLQLAKIKVQNNTPVFTVIQPAVQPLIPAKPSKKLILVGFVFLSFVGAVFWILKKDLWNVLLRNTQKY